MTEVTLRAKRVDKIATVILGIMVALIIVVLAFFVGYILVRGVPHLSFDFLVGEAQSFRAGGGIGAQIFNSFYLLLITLIISVPLAIGAAIYLAEYAPKNKVTAAISTTIETLSSLPSIVVGLFGYLLLVTYFGWGFSILSGAIALTMFNLPILVRVIQQALEAVPAHQRDAGLAMGLTRWETTIHVVLPDAMPGIVTGIILSAGRVFGEAAALIYTAGMSSATLDFSSTDFTAPNNPWNPMRPAETLAVHIWKINSEGVVPDRVDVSNGTAAVLLISILIFNLAARFIGGRLQKRITAE